MRKRKIILGSLAGLLVLTGVYVDRKIETVQAPPDIRAGYARTQRCDALRAKAKDDHDMDAKRIYDSVIRCDED